MSAKPQSPTAQDEETRMLLTTRIDRQLLGIPVSSVREVLKEYKIAHIPLAAGEIYGSINLRGRIVTVIDVHKRLGLAPMRNDAAHMFVVVEHHGQYYSLMFDAVEEVLDIPGNRIEKAPANLNPQWNAVTAGVHRLKNELLVIIDVPALLNFK